MTRHGRRCFRLRSVTSSTSEETFPETLYNSNISYLQLIVISLQLHSLQCRSLMSEPLCPFSFWDPKKFLTGLLFSTFSQGSHWTSDQRVSFSQMTHVVVYINMNDVVLLDIFLYIVRLRYLHTFDMKSKSILYMSRSTFISIKNFRVFRMSRSCIRVQEFMCMLFQKGQSQTLQQ